MTSTDFINRIEPLYGNYSNPQRVIVASWLDKKSPDELPRIFAIVLESVSWQYKSPPGPKELNDAYRQMKAEQRECGRPELQDYTPLMIDEPKLSEEQTAEIFAEIKRLTKEKRVKS